MGKDPPLTHAFKCDNCNNYYDGQSPRERDLRVGDDYLMRVTFAKLVAKPAEERKPVVEEITGLNIEKIPDGLAALMGMRVGKIEELDGKELHAADFCPDCTHKVLADALVQAQAEGVAALIAAQLDIKEPNDG